VTAPAETYLIVAPPRSASTPLARILWHHPAIRYYAHEPYGAVYHDGAGPEAAERAIAAAADLADTVGGKSATATGLVVKEMTFQVGPHFADLAAHTGNAIVFNLRDPRLSVSSRMRMRRKQGLPELFPTNESGWDDLVVQLAWCRDHGVAHVVIDATELRQRPKEVAPPLLEALGLDYDESVLQWTPVKGETVQAVADQGQWYQRVLSSTRLEAADEPVPPLDDFPVDDGFRAHVEWCLGMYEAVLAGR
jgi:Sulfotransferase domain